MTRENRILHLLKHPMAKLSCQQICDVIAIEEGLAGNKAKYLSGSISSKLKKMVDLGILEYHMTKTSRGGHIYQVK